MLGYAAMNKTIYKRAILSLKIAASLTGIGLSFFVCLLVIQDFEHNTLLKVIYIMAIYTSIISIEKTLKLVHKFFKNRKHD